MLLAHLPEGKRFTLLPAGPAGRLLARGPMWAVVRLEQGLTDRVTGPYVTHLRVNTEIEPLPE